jgi:predicted transglutaminase-like cysteine proteinase
MWGDRIRGQDKGRPAWVGCLLPLMALAAVTAGGGMAPASARPVTPKTMGPATHEPARPTAAWSRFCAQHPAECAIDPSEPEIIPLTPEALASITSINAMVNRTVQPVTDLEHWGVADRWDFPDDGKGDCEDIQLLKRKLLVEKGLPRRAMRMTVVIDRNGEGHAVLTVRTSKGDLILDNARDRVLPSPRTGYEFVKREGPDGRSWVWLDGTSGPVVTAAR